MKTSLKFTAIVLVITIPFSAQAHRPWLLPSATVTTPNQWVTVDAAVTTDVFVFDHNPMPINNLIVTAPDGSTIAPQNISNGKLRTTFDLQLVQNGTYRISNGSSSLNASYKVGEETKRWRGTAETFAKDVPADAQELQVTQAQSRVETFITAGRPTALKNSDSGLELVPVTHPNDLFAGETANFKFTIDGKPAAGLEIEILQDGSRYRTKQDEMMLKTDASGAFSVTWPSAGRYRLEVATTDDKTSIPQAKQRRLSYVATFEVLPQ